jgi:hypothetical protein
MKLRISKKSNTAKINIFNEITSLKSEKNNNLHKNNNGGGGSRTH